MDKPVVAYGYVTLNDKRVTLWFYDGGKVFARVADERDFTEYVGEPVLLECIKVEDEMLYDKYFYAWED